MPAGERTGTPCGFPTRASGGSADGCVSGEYKAESMNESAHPHAQCGIAARRGVQVDCPDGGCTLLTALGNTSAASDDGCPVEQIAERARFDASVVWTLDMLREELERSGMPLSLARAQRSRGARHEDVLRRWPSVP